MRFVGRGCLVALLGLLGCSWFSGDADPLAPPDNAWYNSSFFRPIFGDFNRLPTVPLEAYDAGELRPRGEYLTKAVAACGSCHGADPVDPDSPLSGGRQLGDRFGVVAAPNITPDTESGIGGWNVADVVRALRASIDRDGRPLSLEAHGHLRWMADKDAKAIAVYVLSQPAVKNELSRRRLGPFERNSLFIMPQHSEVKGYVPQPQASTAVAYGRYLSHHVAQCVYCHSPDGGKDDDYRFSGGVNLSWLLKQIEPGEKRESSEAVFRDRFETAWKTGDYPLEGGDIRGSSVEGIQEWSEAEVVNYLRTGITTTGFKMDPRFCPWTFYSRMSEQDLTAIALYLKSR